MTNAVSWYALQLRYQCECFARTALYQKGYEVFLPTYVDRTRSRRQGKMTEKPLFPGYLFLRFNSTLNSKVVTTPGVIRIVTFGGVPAEIPGIEIDNIRRIASSQHQSRTWKHLDPGTKVRIESGALKGVEGSLATKDGRRHLVVSVDILCRSVGVLLDEETEMSVIKPHRFPKC